LCLSFTPSRLEGYLDRERGAALRPALHWTHARLELPPSFIELIAAAGELGKLAAYFPTAIVQAYKHLGAEIVVACDWQVLYLAISKGQPCINKMESIVTAKERRLLSRN
jgi:hypothetical protein